ncbi:hypothetical protein [Halobacteriaceae bacterium SHR40]|uniref:hypothetical protein n=1 Tax=Halovenus amylolytica TaxID=2500550 RepID=UPI000FE2BD4F
MKTAERRIAEIVTETVDEVDLDHAEKLVDEAIKNRYELPETDFTKVYTSETESYSSKISNIKVFDIETAFAAFGQTGSLLSGDPTIIGSAVAVLCATLINNSKVQISAPAGLIYALAYEHRHKKWEIPKENLFHISKEKSQELDSVQTINKEEFSRHIRELDRVECIDIEKKDEEEIIVLRERCTSAWEK